MKPIEGWFADIDDEAPAGAPWRPYLQWGGCCLPLAISFSTEAECEDFIRKDLVGKPMLETDAERRAREEAERAAAPPGTYRGLDADVMAGLRHLIDDPVGDAQPNRDRLLEWVRKNLPRDLVKETLDS